MGVEGGGRCDGTESYRSGGFRVGDALVKVLGLFGSLIGKKASFGSENVDLINRHRAVNLGN